jgi:hypothetical protein
MKLLWLLLAAALPCSAQDAPFNIIDLFSPSAPTAVRQSATRLVRTGIVRGTIDQVSRWVSVDATEYHGGDAVSLSLSMQQPGGKLRLVITATHDSDSWIFANSAEFRIGTNVVTLRDEHPKRSVEHPGVLEIMTWGVRTKETQSVVKAIAAGKCTLCALRGSDRDRLAKIYTEDFNAILTVYFALGGEPLNL